MATSCFCGVQASTVFYAGTPVLEILVLACASWSSHCDSPLEPFTESRLQWCVKKLRAKPTSVVQLGQYVTTSGTRPPSGEALRSLRSKLRKRLQHLRSASATVEIRCSGGNQKYSNPQIHCLNNVSLKYNKIDRCGNICIVQKVIRHGRVTWSPVSKSDRKKSHAPQLVYIAITTVGCELDCNVHC